MVVNVHPLAQLMPDTSPVSLHNSPMIELNKHNNYQYKINTAPYVY